MRRTVIATTLLVALAVIAVAGIAASAPPPQQGPQPASEVELRLDMQHMWENHVRDLNDLINAVVNGDPSTQAILNKSLGHVDMMTASLATFYGQQAASSLNQELKAHEMSVYDYAVAAKAGNQAGMQTVMTNSQQINTQIAQCLSSLNPNWPFEVVKAAFDQHVNDLVTITQQMLAGDFVGALNTLDVAVEHAQAFANTMTNGLVAQFPDRFA